MTVATEKRQIHTFFPGYCKRLKKSSWWWQMSCALEIRRDSSVLSKGAVLCHWPHRSQEFCVFVYFTVCQSQEGTGRESIANIFSYSWVLSMGSCKIRPFVSHELPGHPQLWWQVIDDSVAVRAARQIQKAALPEQIFLCTNKFGKPLWTDSITSSPCLMALTFMSEESTILRMENFLKYLYCCSNLINEKYSKHPIME